MAVVEVEVGFIRSGIGGGCGVSWVVVEVGVGWWLRLDFVEVELVVVMVVVEVGGG